VYICWAYKNIDQLQTIGLSWVVRIRKSTRLDEAFMRLTENEIGCSVKITSARWKGVYQHFYDDCVFGTETSRYDVILAYELELELDRNNMILPNGQHS
jgi:colanic acid biosynthesis protein WcaH